MRVETANWRCDGGELWKFYEIGIIDVPQVLFTERGNRQSFGVFDTENLQENKRFHSNIEVIVELNPVTVENSWSLLDLKNSLPYNNLIWSSLTC